MKQVFGIIVCFLSLSAAYAQRVVNYSLFKDIDDYNTIDTAIIAKHFQILDLYSGEINHYNKDSCKHYCHERYDSTGMLMEVIKGDDLDSNNIDYIVHYKKVSDTVYESVVKYPLGSKVIPDSVFIDTLINKKSLRWCLYKKDRENNTVIRSLYYIKNPSDIKIERYDTDKKLIQIYYPLGHRKPLSEWTDSIGNEFGKTVTKHQIYSENDYREIDMYDKKNKLLEHTYWNNTFGYWEKTHVRELIIYDTANNPIIRNTVGENNQFISVEHYYYKKGVLVRYTKQDGFNDDNINEEKVFDEAGKIILFRSKPYYSNVETVWKYFYNDYGLNLRQDVYKNGEFRASRFFFYK